jgi:putative endopeptidase
MFNAKLRERVRPRACLLAGIGLLAGQLMGHSVTAAAADVEAASPPLGSGIDTQYIDHNVRPQDDFFRYVNGVWLDNTEIPADKSRYGSFDKLNDDSLESLRGLIEQLHAGVDAADPDQQKILDLYDTFMDEAALERLDVKPLAAEFAHIAVLKSKQEIPALIAHLNRIGAGAPYAASVHQDARDATKYCFDLSQAGLGLPDRDYYLQDDEHLKQARTKYRDHVEAMLRLAGDHDAAHEADSILALETSLAKIQWTKVENRDPVKTYNPVKLKQLDGLAPGYDWNSYLSGAGVTGKIDYVVISQPSYITAFNALIASTPLPVWRSYFRWRVLSSFAPLLSRKYVDEAFAFYGTALRGTPKNRPRWKRGVGLVDGVIGEGLGRLYVARYFPPESKRRMDELVGNLLEAYRGEMQNLAWMGPETRQKAMDKLAHFTTKIGYPQKWRDYGKLKIVRGDLVGNVVRSNQFDFNRDIAKLGNPIDRGEWHMTPQTVNAYYNPEMNEIVFPAAILHPPFFNPAADDAVNYGGIGGVIGHEISHGFDDQGSQYDGLGNLLNPPGWFTQEDLERFKSRTHALVQQYAAYSPVPGFPINGELTLGENIADNSGIAIAYKAYRLSLGGKEAPVIDGLTGDQRFYMGWAQVWRSKTRENEAIVRIKSDPHSPAQFRGELPERNQAGFYEAFGVKEGDKMYLPPDQRVTLW